MVDLLVEQIEFADVVVLNKIDDASASAAATPRARSSARSIPKPISSRPISPRRRSSASSTPAASTSRRRSSIRSGSRSCTASPTIRRRPRSTASAASSTVRAGRSSPRNSIISCTKAWAGVIRAKGHFWLATRPQWVGELSQAGAIVRTEGLGFWWANVPARPLAGRSVLAAIAEEELERTLWRPPTGDRLHRRRHGRGRHQGAP